MKNVNTEIKKIDGKELLVITVDLGEDLGPSKSGKTKIVATTEGIQKVPGTDVSIGLNVMRYPKDG